MRLFARLFCRRAAEKAPGVPSSQGKTEVPKHQVSLSPTVMQSSVALVANSNLKPLQNIALLFAVCSDLPWDPMIFQKGHFQSRHDKNVGQDLSITTVTVSKGGRGGSTISPAMLQAFPLPAVFPGRVILGEGSVWPRS